jgi:hypothetical protein
LRTFVNYSHKSFTTLGREEVKINSCKFVAVVKFTQIKEI